MQTRMLPISRPEPDTFAILSAAPGLSRDRSVPIPIRTTAVELASVSLDHVGCKGIFIRKNCSIARPMIII